MPVRRPTVPSALLPATATATVCALCAWRLGPGLDLAAFLVLGVTGVALARTDIATLRLPRTLTLPALAAGLFLLGAQALERGDLAPYTRALLGALAFAAALVGLAVARPGALGAGDVKLAGVLGLHLCWLGWGVLLAGAALAFLLAGGWAWLLLAAGRAHRDTRLPLGPWLLAGALLAVLGSGPRGPG